MPKEAVITFRWLLSLVVFGMILLSTVPIEPSEPIERPFPIRAIILNIVCCATLSLLMPINRKSSILIAAALMLVVLVINLLSWHYEWGII